MVVRSERGFILSATLLYSTDAPHVPLRYASERGNWIIGSIDFLFGFSTMFTSLL